MDPDEAGVTLTSNKDRELLERFGLVALLEDEEFLRFIGELILAFHDRHGSAPLSAIVELISAAIKYETKIMDFLIMTDIGQEEKNRVLSIFGLAAIEQLTKRGYISTKNK